MVRTLRLYDETGAEIGWVSADPHDFHVDESTENRRELVTYLRQRDTDTVATGCSVAETNPDTGGPVRGSWSGERKVTDYEADLDRLGTTLVYDFDVASYALRDEERGPGTR
ncbi:hypothetical protein BRC81_02760 [Halobacteriales archaeon QS_1_68_20]|nr:MAG: hypothetical protein BRC81_02760 [Halobacteriales archaeon QS_1_68_20]